MIMPDVPPALVIPNHYELKRPAIIRPSIDLSRYFPVEWDRNTRRAIVSELFKQGVQSDDRTSILKIIEAIGVPAGIFKQTAAAPVTSLYDILTTAGFTTNLKLCLDAGISTSYNNGASWLDLSGNGYDFFLGADGTTDGTDPTFNGTINGGSSAEYFSFDGGDYFTYDSSNETWMQNLHKDNAIFSWIFVGWIGALSTAQAFIGSASGVGGGVGIGVYISSGNVYKFRSIAVSPVSDLSFATTTVTEDAWHFFGGAVNEATGANGSRLVLDGTAEQFTSTYSSPSAASASNTLKIGRGGNGSNLTATSRVAMLAMWEGTALTSSDLLAIRTAIQSARPGLI